MKKAQKKLSLIGLLLLSSLTYAQIKGQVNDELGFPSQDVEIKVKNQDQTFYTDENGHFSIDLPLGTILIINGLEYKVDHYDLGVIDLKPKSENVDLDVVVVKSIFEAPQSAGTTTLKGDDFKNLNPSTSIDQLLSGKVSGLSSQAQNGAPGSNANVVIRGAIGLNGGVKNPLYVVDGTYLSAADIVALNPNDVEEVKVLKDASQVAIYGSRGANGVILITTKRAKKNEGVISYSSRIGFGENLGFKNINLMNGRQFLNFQNEISQLKDLETGRSLGLGVARSQEEINQLSQYAHNWKDDIFKRSVISSHYLTFNKNDGETAQSFSLGYDQDNGTVEFYKGFERITSSINISSKMKDWLRYGIDINGAYTKRDLPSDVYNFSSPFTNIYLNYPYASVYELDEAGNVKLDETGSPIYNSNVNILQNPVLDQMKYTDAEYRNFRLFGSGFLEADLTEKLTFRTTFGARYNRNQFESFVSPLAFVSKNRGTGGSKADIGDDRFAYNWRNEFNYINKFDLHTLRFTLASEYSNEKNYNITLRSEGYPSGDKSVQSLANRILNSSLTNRWEEARFGYLGAVSYDYNRKYFLDFYFRRDGSSLAGLEKQYGNFWGASVTWDVTREDFLKGNQYLTGLKLKASYGEVGDDSSIARYINQAYMSLNGNYRGNTAAIPPRYAIDSKMTWETNRKLNIGTEFDFFRHILTGSFAYFNDNRKNFIFKTLLPIESGNLSKTVNAGEITSKGIELDLNIAAISQKNFKLSFYGNLTSISYKINDLNGNDQLLIGTGDEISPSMIHVKGQSPYQFRLVRYVGINPENGKNLYLDKDGHITEEYRAEDAVATGKTPLPKLYGGFGLNTHFYGFDISADFTYSLGAYMYNYTYRDLTNAPMNFNQVVEANDFWRNPGDHAKFGRPTTLGEQESTKYLEKSNYVMFRNLSIGYTFTELLKNTFIKNLRLYAQVQNLALWTKYHGDPVSATGSQSMMSVGDAGYVSGSYSLFTYPQVRTYSLGFNITF
ncbi:SusC/RagA family TonB-linked outer membrane protein [Empedobacter brevis]|uniref:SusC/RagA family TonB-linked outer membrane protein n=1 Tax=Empedobacter brevis TaxID=247 RepID=UPI0023F12354|nr:SusC/RagA family TonB-linked outer membrane protein [Empedobacter brevis]